MGLFEHSICQAIYLLIMKKKTVLCSKRVEFEVLCSRTRLFARDRLVVVTSVARDLLVVDGGLELRDGEACRNKALHNAKSLHIKHTKIKSLHIKHRQVRNLRK